MKKEVEVKKWLYIFMMVAMLIGVCTLVYVNREMIEKEEQIKQLRQNSYEQMEEKEVYRNRCRMLEDLIEGSGMVVDDCECN